MQPTYRLLLWTLAILGFAVDQASKYSVFATLPPPDYRCAMIPGAFDLVADRVVHKDGGESLHVNQGALFGWFKAWGVQANTAFAIISFLAAVVIVVWGSCRSTAIDRRLCIALGLILAGTLGNLYDRLYFGGVRDFLHWHWGVNFAVFNLADSCLVLGAGLLLLQAFRPQPGAEPVKPATPAVALSAANPCISAEAK